MTYSEQLETLVADAEGMARWTADRLRLRSQVSRELARKNRADLEATASALEAVASDLRKMAEPDAALNGYLDRLARKVMG